MHYLLLFFQVGKLVMNGAKPEAPRECPFDLARRLMYQCWAFEVSERISALEFKANAIVVGGVVRSPTYIANILWVF
eukprot:m.358784 g.358784  ORF g.358784 m.358784 type:complete len:77 (+) comp16619_c0_seq77:1601-1831(+)